MSRENENAITPAEVQEIQVADHQEVSKLTQSVLETDKQLQQSNIELELLNESLGNLKRSLDRNDELKATARSRMQKLVTRLC